MVLENKPFFLCVETIYSFIYTNPYCVERKQYQYLRRGKRKRINMFKIKIHSENILNKISIEKRPKYLSNRI